MLEFRESVDSKLHDENNLNSPYQNLLQTSKWAKVKNNWQNTIVGVYRDHHLIASALILIKPLPFHYCVMYIPRGPIMDYQNDEVISFFLQELKKWAKSKKCIYIKFDPDIHIGEYHLDEPRKINDSLAQSLIHLFEKNGAKHSGFTQQIYDSAQPRYQAATPLEYSLEETYPKGTQKRIKVSHKNHLHIISKHDAQDFYKIIQYTENRKKITLRDTQYFQKLCDIYQDQCYMLFVEIDIEALLIQQKKSYEQNKLEIQQLLPNQVKKQRKLDNIHHSLEKEIALLTTLINKYGKRSEIACQLAIKSGNTMEMLYSGMNEDFKRYLPQYYLYSYTMNLAKELECKYANMGGVDGNFKDGLTSFKAQFNPIIFEYIGEFNMPIHPLLFHIGNSLLKLRKKLASHQK